MEVTGQKKRGVKLITLNMALSRILTLTRIAPFINPILSMLFGIPKRVT